MAITEKDPVEFAREMGKTLNELSEDGWNITGMMERAGALIISAQKTEIPKEVLEALARMPNQQRPSVPVREDNTTEEVTYSYLEDGKVQSLQCPDIETAKGYMEEHVADESVLPISIVVMAITHYELKDLPHLRQLLGPKQG